jgi:hypothetical protein
VHNLSYEQENAIKAQFAALEKSTADLKRGLDSLKRDVRDNLDSTTKA